MIHYVNAICGWQYPESSIRAYLASEEAKLLTMDFDFPCKRPCNLKCKYCFIETDERELASRMKDRHEKLSISELKIIFRDAVDLGCRSSKLIGDQEPLQEDGFVDFIEYISEELGMWVVVFTNGEVLDNDELCIKIHGMNCHAIIEKLKRLRVSIMLKFHSFTNIIEDNLVRSPGYAQKRNKVLDLLIKAGFNDPPTFETMEEKYIMTGVNDNRSPDNWTRLGLESVLTPQCMDDAEKIYRLKIMKRLYVDLDPPVPIGLTRTADWRKKFDLHIDEEELLDLVIRLYRINEDLGIPFEGASPYFGGLPCSQLPYGLYVNARGRIYPCCGCPDIEVDGSSEYLGHVSESNALANAIKSNPYRVHYKKYGYAYDTAPFNSRDYSGFGVYHGCPYRDRAGDILPRNWELIVADHLGKTEEYLADISCYKRNK